MNPLIKEIPLHEFDLSLSGMRIMNMPRVIQLEKSMKLHGQLQPVVARSHEGGYQLIDGFKRLYAAETILMDTLQCRVLNIDLLQAKVLLLSYNRPHQSMEALEEARVLQDLQKTHSMDQRSLSRLTGYSRSWVSRRLALIGKMDEVVSSEIMMGALTSSHARALTKLPRGNQAEVARVITTHYLTSRQSDVLADAFLEAKSEDERRYMLSHPEHVLWNDQQDKEEDLFDIRLSSYGNDLMKGVGYVIHSVQIMLSMMEDRRTGMLNESERVIITPELGKVPGYTDRLKEAISHLLIH
jgi:ParB family transcriptional regulator, chromosome partitioning protein